MNRSTAREIAVHLAFELAFSSDRAEALLERELTLDAFAARAKDEPLYTEFPGEGELGYITTLVRGVGGHGAELDGYIEKYAKGWRFSRIDRVASAIMRVTMYEILYMPDIPYSRLTAARHSSSESSPAARPGPARPKQSPSAPAPPGDIRHIC